MSRFSTHSITCSQCGHIYAMEVVGSVNADRRPDLRDAILAEDFQTARCERCGHSFRMEPEFSYLDGKRGQWIAAYPARELLNWHALQAAATALFERSYGRQAPGAAAKAGEGLAPRLTFGWPAVREKLLLRELGLDDVVIEMVKLDLIRRIPEAPLRPGVELRLESLADGRMRFEWLDAQDERVLSALSVGRELYDLIAAGGEDWAEVRALLADGVFVDMQKTYLSEAEAEAALSA